MAQNEKLVIASAGLIGLSVVLAAAFVHIYITGVPQATLTGHNTYVHTLVFSPDGSTLGTQGLDGVVELWDMSACRMRAALPDCEKPDWFRFTPPASRDGAFSAKVVRPKGEWRYNNVQIVNALTGDVVLSLSSRQNEVNAIAISPDGRMFATGGGSTDQPWLAKSKGDVRLWEVESGRLLTTLNRHSRPISALAFSPNGAVLATASEDGTIMIWNLNKYIHK